MAELSDFLPKSSSGYIADYYSSSTVTSTTTTATSDNASIVNISGQGVLFLKNTSSTAVITVTLDGKTFSGNRETLSRMFGQGGQDTSGGQGVNINVAFRSSVSVGVSGQSSGTLTVTVSV